MGCELLQKAFSFLYALLFFALWPVRAAFALLGLVFQIFGLGPWLLGFFVIAMLSIPIATHHHEVHSYAEYFMRCVVEPIWTNSILPLFELFETPYNNLICWWNGVNWSLYGYVNFFFIPTAIDCGIKELLFRAIPVATIFLDEFVGGYIASGNFLTGFYDITNLGNAAVFFMEAWVDFWCCMCMDLCAFIHCSPMPFIFIVYPFIQVSGLLNHIEFYLAVGDLINVAAALIQLIVRLLTQIFTCGFSCIDPRPDFEVAAIYFCSAGRWLMRATEKMIQCFWDAFIPFKFDFTEFFCIIDNLNCILADSFVVLTRVFINIDIVVFDIFTPNPATGHGPRPGSLWHGSIRDVIIRILNTWGAVTDPEYFFDVHLIDRKTMPECVCILISRLICDPTNETTACFNQGTADFLGDFDFCCLTNAILITLNDWNKFQYSLWLHVTDADSFFIWLDGQPDTKIIAGPDGDFVAIVSCILSSLRLIPVVGYCLHNFLTSIFRVITGSLELITIRLVLSLFTLPYFAIALNMQNFLLRPELGEDWDELIFIIIGETPTSALNCLCFILNVLAIPPITFDENFNFVPCGCQPVGYIPPPPTFKKIDDVFVWTHDFLEKQFGHKTINRFTPIMSYANEKETFKGGSTINPVILKERILDNMALYGAKMIPEQMRDLDAFIAKKQDEIRDKWRKIQRCQDETREANELKEKYPWRYEFLKQNGELPGQESCKDLHDFMHPGSITHSQAILDDLSGMYYKGDYHFLEGRNATHYQCETEPAAMREERIARETKRGGGCSSCGGCGGGMDPRLIITHPPEPTSFGCPGPNEPLLPCFDTCCSFRAGIRNFGVLFRGVGHILIELIQGSFQTPEFAYFTSSIDDPDMTGTCPRCFEQDLGEWVRELFQGFVCLCRLLNLILPSTPIFPRPDICCNLVALGDGIAGILQIIINAIKSLALDPPRFFYFTGGSFSNDVDVLFDLTLRFVSCTCNQLRYIIPTAQLTGGALDPCCIAEKLFIIIIELERLLLQLIINIGLAAAGTEIGLAYWRDAGIARGWAEVERTGIVKQLDVIIDAMFGAPGGPCAAQGRDQGSGGLPSCFCGIITTIIPIRPNPLAPVSDPGNCPFIDLCCPLSGIGFLINDLLKFLARLLATTWQSWSPTDYGKPPGDATPIAFTDFLFCDETSDQPRVASCAKINPIVDRFVGIIAGCPCQFGEIADAFLSSVLPSGNFQCFCGRYDGFFSQLGTLIREVIVAIVTLIRRISDITYWRPTIVGPASNALMNSWAFHFAGPSLNALCNLITSLSCVLDAVLSLPCSEYRKRSIRSVVAWISRMLIMVVAFVEGFIRIFAEGHTDPCVEGQSGPCPTGTTSTGGISAAALAEVFVSLFSFPIDMLFADSSVVCSVVNPPKCPASDPCCCYSPVGSYQAQPVGGIFTNDNRCGQCLDNACTLVLQSYAFPTCDVDPCDGVACLPDKCVTDPEDPNFGCFLEKPCVDIVLPSCDSDNPLLNPLDGIVMAILRYMRCMIAAIFPGGLASIFDALITLVSWIWQIFTPIIRFIASLILFIFLIFAFLGGGCGCHGLPNGAYVQRGGLCYPCEENPNIRSTWWTDQDTVHDPNIDPRPPGEPFLCLTGYNARDGTFTNASNVQAIDGKCIDTSLRDGPGGCAPGCTIGYGPGECPVCNWHQNDIGEVGNSIDCDAFGGASCTLCGANPLVPCGIIQLWEAFSGILGAFIDVFTVGPITPTSPPSKNLKRGQVGKGRMNTVKKQGGVDRADFEKRVEQISDSGLYGSKYAMELMIEAAWGYNIDDCMTDMRSCVCRNFVVPGDICNVNHPELKLAPHQRNPKTIDEMSLPVIDHMADMCDGKPTRCDHIISHCRGMKWSQVPMSEQVEYVDCLDKMISGERLNSLMPAFPADYYYTNTGPVHFFHNLKNSFSEKLQKSRDEARREFAEKMTDKDFSTKEEKSRFNIMKRRQKILKEASEDPRWTGSMILPFFAEIDQYEYRLKDGTYHDLISRAWYNIRYKSQTMPFHAMWDMLVDQGVKNGRRLYNVRWRETLDRTYRGIAASIEFGNEILEKGPIQLWKEAKARLYNHPENVARRKRAAEVRELVKSSFYEGPIYKWWVSQPETTNTIADYHNPFRVFINHLNRTFHFYRENWERYPPNWFNMDRHIRRNFQETIGKRWEKKWTPQQLANWEGLGRIFYKFKEVVMPGSFTAEQKRGWLIDGQCKLVDGAIDQIVFLVQYCTMDFVPNFAKNTREQWKNQSAAWRWVEQMAADGERLYRSSPRYYYPEEHAKRIQKYNDEKAEWKGLYDWLKTNSLNRVRRKVDFLDNPKTLVRNRLMASISKQQWLRATVSAPFELTTWFLTIIDSITGTNINMEIDMIFMQIEDWLSEENTDFFAGPVGLKYWILFFTECRIKPREGELPQNAGINVNCSVGIGLENAIGWVLAISFLVFVVGSIILPSTMLPLTGASAVVFFLIVVPAVAWHYSPRCWILTPSLFPVYEVSLGIQLNVGLPVLPECLMTELRNLVSKYITTCYAFLWDTNLRQLFPPYMIMGNPCPVCPERVHFYNCKDLGIGTGLDNAIYLVILVFPWLGPIIKDIAQLWIFQIGVFGEIFGFLTDSINKFSGLSGDQMAQFNWCSVVTAPSLGAVAFVALILFLSIAVLWTILWDGLTSFIQMFVASPFMYFIPFTGWDLYGDLSVGESSGGGDPPDAYVGVEITRDPETGRRRVRRRRAKQPKMIRLPFMSWMDDAAEYVSVRIGHFFKTIKRD